MNFYEKLKALRTARNHAGRSFGNARSFSAGGGKMGKRTGFSRHPEPFGIEPHFQRVA